VVLATAQAFPELSIILTLPEIGLYKNPVVPALNIPERVSDYFEKIGVGRFDRPVQCEFDHRLRTTDRLDLTLVISSTPYLLGDVGRELDDLLGATILP
jgi:hypothetical protein